MRRRTELQVQANGLNGCVWIESFSLQSGTELQLEQLSSEDSFTGELLRLAGRELASEEDSDLVRSALRPLLEQPELRRLLEEVTWEEKRDWLRRGMEYAAVLFMEESGRRGDAE